MTDEEVICTWMEPKPTEVVGGCLAKWWYWVSGEGAQMRDLTLDALWEVEERLTEEQWEVYRYRLTAPVLLSSGRHQPVFHRMMWHADAPTRIKALAAVLRPTVERP